MEKFRERFERVAMKYAEYVEAKITSSVTMIPLKPGQEIPLAEPKEEAEERMKEMQTLCQIAETLQNLDADVIRLDAEKLDNLQPTDAELEAFRKATVAFIQNMKKLEFQK